MKNYRGGGSKYREIVTAAAARTSGQVVVEDGFAGIAEVTAATGERYALRRDGEFELPMVGGAQKGHTAFVLTASPFTVTTAAYTGGAPGAGTRVLGRVTAVPGNSNTGIATEEPKAGKMWVAVGPQEQGA